ncbi:MAG: dihydropteroate synthase [Thermodesulfobacteriota bacterium]
MSDAPGVRVMGIINVTPDSFSDGGRCNSAESSLTQAKLMIGEGADILDIGGESTRPFAEPVELFQELDRVIPAIKAIRKESTIPISIDTSKAEVARQALASGADVINDITALRKDPEMVRLAADTDVPLILMHMQGSPGDMQVEPHYEDVVAEIIDFFQERLSFLDAHSISRERIIVDPGIGFGKSLQHNLTILKNLDAFSVLGCPVLLGHSRKRFIGDVTGLPVEQRDLPTAVISALAARQGVAYIRVHDVASTRTALTIESALS